MYTWRVILTTGKEWDIEANEIEISDNVLIFWIGNEILVAYGPGSWVSAVRKELGYQHMTCVGR